MDITELSAAIQIFHKASNVKSFEKWLASTHKLSIDTQIFSGYRYFLECAYHFIFNSLEYDYALGLKEDEIFKNARILTEFTPTCEKAKFLINFNSKSSYFLRANKVSDLKDGLKKFNLEALNLITKIVRYGYTNSNIPNNEVLKYNVIANTYLYFHQIGAGDIPYAYFTTRLNKKFDSIKQKRVFAGYKYALQYLWYQLLEEKELPLAVKNLHKSNRWNEHEVVNEKPKIIINSTEDSVQDFIRGRRIDLRKRKDFDSYFWRVRRDVIDPLSRKMKQDIVLWGHNSIHLKKHPQKRLFTALLKPVNYSKKVSLDEIFLWHEVEYIDNHNSTIYLGIPTFITLLAGAVELKRYKKLKEKIKVIRFVHTNDFITKNNKKDANDYSYALMINSFWGRSQREEGWLVFFNSCGDYSGYSGGEYRKTEELIEEYHKNGKIEIQSVNSSLKDLEKYLNKYSTIYSDKIDSSIKKNKTKGENGEMKGFLFELFYCYYASKMFPNAIIEWSNGNNMDDEIDVSISQGDILYAVECKVNPNRINVFDENTKLTNKISKLSPVHKEVKKIFIFWHEPDADIRKALYDLKIDYCAISKTVRYDLQVNNQRVFNIFDSPKELPFDFEIIDKSTTSQKKS